MQNLNCKFQNNEHFSLKFSSSFQNTKLIRGNTFEAGDLSAKGREDLQHPIPIDLFQALTRAFRSGFRRTRGTKTFFVNKPDPRTPRPPNRRVGWAEKGYRGHPQ